MHKLVLHLLGYGQVFYMVEIFSKAIYYGRLEMGMIFPFEILIGFLACRVWSLSLLITQMSPLVWLPWLIEPLIHGIFLLFRHYLLFLNKLLCKLFPWFQLKLLIKCYGLWWSLVFTQFVQVIMWSMSDPLSSLMFTFFALPLHASQPNSHISDPLCVLAQVWSYVLHLGTWDSPLSSSRWRAQISFWVLK